MTSGSLHLVKLCVGAERVDDLVTWQAGRVAERRAAGLDPRPVHVTRMRPRRDAELLDGGSLYWVFKGLVLARQAIEGLEQVTGSDGIERCAIVLSPKVARTAALPRRPFQGWRYLPGADAPPDLREGASEQEADMPAPLLRALSEVGVR